MPFVVTLPKSAEVSPEIFSKRAKDAGADILEIRGDLTPSVPAFISSLPILLSPRGADVKAMIDVLKPTYLDIDDGESIPVFSKDTQLICSYHNYECVPSEQELEKIVGRLLKKNPAIIKIAARAQCYRDLVKLEKISKDLHAKNIPSVVLAMGEYAAVQRLLSPYRDALTYTCLEQEDRAAPGQIMLSEYLALQKKNTPKIFGILGGAQVASSFSPKIHNTLFVSHGIDSLYTTFPASDLRDAWEGLTQMGISGFSVTAPWKQEILPFLDTVQEIAAELGSVNTVIKRDGKWVGENTDVAGIEQGYPSLRNRHHAVILGAGGVVPSVIEALKSLDVQTISVWARRPEAAQEIASRFGIKAISSIENIECDVCIKAISEDITVPLPIFTPAAIGIDLQYGKTTKFMEELHQKNIQVVDGLPMLLAQALEQFRFFTGIVPSPRDFSLISSLFHGK